MAARMKFVRFAPFLLAFAFAGHLIDVLVLEPRLGFPSPQDFYDVDKILPVVDHYVWQLGGFYHLLAGVAILVLAREPVARDHPLAPYATTLGIMSATLFIVVFMTNRVGMRELGFIAALELGDMQPTHGAYLILRSIVLFTAVTLLGAFLLIGNGARVLMASDRGVARYLGMATGLVCLLITLLPIVPVIILAIIAWGIIAGVVAFKS